VAAITRFPWPKGARADGVVARGLPVDGEWSASLGAAIEASVAREARRAERTLRRRWPAAEVRVVDAAPVPGIMAEARRRGAGVIVLGSRGHGALSRLVLGSVSLGVVRRVPGAALVVRGRLAEPSRFLVGLDGSPHSRRAADFVAGLPPPPGGHVTLTAVAEPAHPPSMGLLPGRVRGLLQGQLAALEEEKRATARREIAVATPALRRAGWQVTADVRVGVPLDELLAGVAAARAQVLVVGARGIGGLERLLLGSVAEGALHRAPVSVLIVR
jgi:nucleotide-binding universal stress UspA family protein